MYMDVWVPTISQVTLGQVLTHTRIYVREPTVKKSLSNGGLKKTLHLDSFLVNAGYLSTSSC